MTVQVFDIPDGVKGIDCNSPLSVAKLASLRTAGYRVATRYVRRVQHHDYDLTTGELLTILQAGFGLNIAQHVDANWVPSAAVGAAYGATAVQECRALGLIAGVTVSCDLEDVRPGTPPQAVIDYLKAWYAAVRGAGYQPMLYVGYNCGISGNDLYYKLPFVRYWSAYNLNQDHYPVVRGVCGRQFPERALYGLRYDPDTYHADAKGGRATCVAITPWNTAP
jgi:Domain of unknown function (DUF1906).